MLQELDFAQVAGIRRAHAFCLQRVNEDRHGIEHSLVGLSARVGCSPGTELLLLRTACLLDACISYQDSSYIQYV